MENQALIPSTLFSKYQYLIDHIDDLSDPPFEVFAEGCGQFEKNLLHSIYRQTKRARIVFKNGYQLSVVFGIGTYGFDEQTFEIAIFENDLMVSELWLPEDENEDDVVLGYVDIQKLEKYIQYIGTLKGKKSMLTTQNAKAIGKMFIIDKTGDTKIIWDANNPDEVKAAREMFNNLRRANFIAHSVQKNGDPGEIIRTFDPSIERIIMIPPVVGG